MGQKPFKVTINQNVPLAMLQYPEINFNFNKATLAEQGQQWWVGGAARVWPQ